jgi:hypothetical protein
LLHSKRVCGSSSITSAVGLSGVFNACMDAQLLP